jgi:uncharacterized membrane protein
MTGGRGGKNAAASGALEKLSEGLIQRRCVMNLIVLSLSHFIHLFATVIWIGGIFMVLLVILPSARTSLESTAMAALMKEITGKFTPLANASILVMVITGIIIALYKEKFGGFFNMGDFWNGTLVVKHLLVALMIIIHFYRGLVLAPRVGKLSAQAAGSPSLSSQVARLQKLSLNLIKANFALGIIVLLATGVLMSK